MNAICLQLVTKCEIFNCVNLLTLIVPTMFSLQVTEEQLSNEAFNDMLGSMTADNGALGNLIAEGNAQAMCQFVGSITSLLNSKAEPEPEPEVIVTTPAPTRGAPRNPKELAAEEARRLACVCTKSLFHSF